MLAPESPSANRIELRRREAVFTGKMELLLSGQLTATMTSMVIIIALVFLQYQHADEQFLWLWLFYMCGVSLARLLAINILDGQGGTRKKPRSVRNWFTLGAFLQGIGWGIAPFGFMPPDQPSLQMVTVFILGGISAAALISMASDPRSFFAFILPTLCPLVVIYALSSRTEDTTIAFTLCCFMLFLAGAIRRNHDNIVRTLTLRFENMELLDRVMREKEEITALNDELSHEIRVRHAAERQVRTLATTDQLTGMANRHRFETRLAESLEMAKRTGQHVGVLLLDLDHFRQANEEYGHQNGDAILVEVAKRIKTECRTIDIVARVGGDEFGVILNALPTADRDNTPVNRIFQSLRLPINLENHEVHMDISAGLAFFPQQYKDGMELIRAADSALALAKANGRNRCEIYQTAIAMQG